MRKGSVWGILLILVVVGVLLALFVWQIFGYRNSLNTLPEGITIAGMDVGGLTTDEAIAALEGVYAQPVELTYQDQLLYLTAESAGLQFDPETTRETIEVAVSSRRSFDGFMVYLLRRPVEPIHVLPTLTYSSDRLEGFLNRTAQQYDRPPSPPVALADALTFRAGRAGYEMDIPISQERVVTALFSATDRQAALAIRVQEAQLPDITQLEQVLNVRLEDFDGIPSVFVKDLQTGAELSINPGVAYGGNNLLKLTVMLEAFRALDEPPTAEQTALLTQTITQNENQATNQLLQVIGRGDVYQGTENLNASMSYLGLINTFMATPYDDTDVVPITIVTPANSRTDLNTQPDPRMQTTAQDIGLLLEMVYQCSQGGGALLVAYPDDLTVSECQQMLDILAENRIDSLIEVGLPPGMPIAHRQSFTAETHADGGIVFSPEGDFVLVVLLYTPELLDWETVSNPLIADIAMATYNYFNPMP